MDVEIGQRYRLAGDTFGTIVSVYVKNNEKSIVMVYKESCSKSPSSIIYSEKEFERMKPLFSDYDEDFVLMKKEDSK